MPADPNAGPARPPSGGDQAAAARFEIVLRGYDRRQVEEHISALERTIAQQREDLEKVRREPSGVSASADTSVFEPAGKKPAAAQPAAQSSGSGLNPEMISSFTSRLQSILQAAEEEAEEVRSNARAFAQAEEQSSRARLDELERRRKAVLSELGRVRNQLDGLLGGPERTTVGAGVTAKGSDKGAESADAGRTEAPRPPTGPGAPSAPSIGGRPAGASNPGQPNQAINRPAGPPPGPGRPGGPMPMRPGQPPTPQPASGKPSPQPTPPSTSQQPHQQSQPKPRPTPSPRPRPTPGGTNLPGVEMTQGPVESGKRNGNGRSDDDGGFGSGAR